MRPRLATASLAAALILAGCDLDRANPNAPTEEATLSSSDGIMALAVGLQNRFGTSTGGFIYAAGLVTDELAAVSAALVTISDAEQGIVGRGAGFVANAWAFNYQTIKTANDIIVNAPNVTLEPGTRSGVIALAYILKAAALGELLQAFQQLPIDTYNTGTPSFVNRQTALATVLALLDSAETTLNAQAPSTQFNSTILARGFDLRNTLLAYRARFLRVSGANDTDVIAAANAVNRRVFSVLPFNDQTRNPLNVASTGSSGVLPRDAFRLSATGDGRLAFHVTAANLTGRIGTPLDNYARYGAPTASIPTYYPDEILLIKAEALANLDRLTEAQAVLDSVRTDCPGLIAEDPNACLPALTGALTRAQLLAEIYSNRRTELFATGLRWEDARRQALVGAGSAAKRCWLPYPIAERNANPANVPTDDPEGIDPPAFPARCF